MITQVGTKFKKHREISKYLRGENFGAQKKQIRNLPPRGKWQKSIFLSREPNRKRNRIQIAFNFCVFVDRGVFLQGEKQPKPVVQKTKLWLEKDDLKSNLFRFLRKFLGNEAKRLEIFQRSWALRTEINKTERREIENPRDNKLVGKKKKYLRSKRFSFCGFSLSLRNKIKK